MKIEVYHDLICPWCRIGEKNLIDAMHVWTEQSGETMEIEYRSYMLYPEISRDGVSFMEMMVRKMGNMSRAYQSLQEIAQAGAPVGVRFFFHEIESLPHTLPAHMLVKLARQGQKTEMVEALFQAYFEKGLNIGNIDILVNIAESFDLNPAEVKEKLEQETFRSKVEKDLAEAKKIGIQSIPFFIINDNLALTGAHPKENFLHAFREVSAS
ncbi:DsbA family oxidoreductase [Thermoactinomyces mirandus]|uniref:DsbA family oxidoreductase n=1 Tax=Thermoactinomyces mirandus TaxID=2756294 RepID=A0A7W2ARH4_9BACL|nr:DsbA family oxidoreductase [Thermoactinomyces mirandus]MBA4602588.1 DsbA family oxidoreductase [Thermoactinomyces mirandus]